MGAGQVPADAQAESRAVGFAAKAAMQGPLQPLGVHPGAVVHDGHLHMHLVAHEVHGHLGGPRIEGILQQVLQHAHQLKPRAPHAGRRLPRALNRAVAEEDHLTHFVHQLHQVQSGKQGGLLGARPASFRPGDGSTRRPFPPWPHIR